MKKLTYYLMALGLFFIQYLPAQPAQLSITDQSVVGNTYTFSIVITASGSDIYLGNSDFIFTYNSAAFVSPSVNITNGGDFGTESGSGSDAASTQDNYLFATATSVSGDRIRINLSGPNPGSETAFERRVAKISSGSSATFGTFEISGYQGIQHIDLQWTNATQISTIEVPSLNEVQIGTLLIAPGEILPVELIHFTAERTQEKSVQLEWATAVEVANKGFEVHHSPDAIDWQILDFVPGNGTTTQAQNYSFLHREALQGDNYYRLKQLDHDGGFEFSAMRVVQIEEGINNNVFTVYPNPCSDRIKIHLLPNITEARFQLFSPSGKLIESQVLNGQTSQHSFNLRHLPKGVYLISTLVGGRQYLKKVVLQ